MQGKNVTFGLLIGVIGVILLAAVAASGQPEHTSGGWEYLWARPVAVGGTTVRPEIETGVVMNDEGVAFEGPVYAWLNAVGSEGWELTEVVDGYYIFKRQRDS